MKPSGRGLPEIALATGLLPVIHDYVEDFLHAHGPEIETGGMLIGNFARTEKREVLRISGFIGAGPRAQCCSESVLFDTEYQARMLELAWRRRPGAGNLGCIHVHPKRMDVCSEKDWLADIEAVRMSDTKVLVFGIITINNPRLDALSLYHRNFKFDFFILGEPTNFEYRHVRPALKPMPLLESQPEPPNLAFTSADTRHGRHYAAWPKVLKDKRRLVAEVRAVEERYGGLAALRLEGSRLFWEYTVLESGRRFPIRVCYPRRYPLEPPHIFSALPLPGSPHQLPGNELCWTNRSGLCDWNPSRDTAATAILAAHRWFACLLVYLTLGAWPSEADDVLQHTA